MSEAQVQEKPTRKAQASAPAKTLIAGVHGDMYHPNGTKITQEGKRLERDNWIDVQIATGKLRVVEE